MSRPFLPMRRWGVILRTFLVTASLAMISRASTVQVISSEEMDFTQGLQSVLVELRASGYDVRVESSNALEPGHLLEVLQSSDSKDLIANVAVVKLGRSGIAYVWLQENDQIYRVTSTGTDPSHAANVLSLRVSELLSLQGEGFVVEPSAKEQKPPLLRPRHAPEEPSEAPRERGLSVLGLLGPAFDAGLRRPWTSLQVALGYPVSSNLVLQLMGHSSLGRSSREFEQGKVSLEERGAALGLAFQTGSRLRWQIGPTLGAGCFLIRSEPANGPAASRTACRTTIGAFSRVGLSWETFSLWLSGQLGYGTRRVALVAENQLLTRLSQPDGSLRLGVGWHF